MAQILGEINFPGLIEGGGLLKAHASFCVASFRLTNAPSLTAISWLCFASPQHPCLHLKFPFLLFILPVPCSVAILLPAAYPQSGSQVTEWVCSLLFTLWCRSLRVSPVPPSSAAVLKSVRQACHEYLVVIWGFSCCVVH